MSQTFSALQRDMVSGQVTRQAVPTAPVAAPNVLSISPTAPSIPEQRLFSALINRGASVTSQFGADEQGGVSLVGLPGESYTVTDTLTGLNLAEPLTALVKWPAANWPPAAFVKFTEFTEPFVKILIKFAEVHTAFPSYEQA